MENQPMGQIAELNVDVAPFSKELSGSWVIQSSHSQIIQLGAIENALAAQHFIRNLQQKLKESPFQRFLVCSVCQQKEEWSLITNQNILLAWLQMTHQISIPYAFINFPLEHFYHSKNKVPESEFFLRDATKLSDLVNVEGWETYCHWLAKDVSAVLSHIPLESLDAYTLEAHLKNFNHEVDSQLLHELEANIAETLVNLGAIYQLYKAPFETTDVAIVLEKKLIKMRSKIHQLLQFQYEILCQVVQVIPIIEKAHPSFIPLKKRAHLMVNLLKNHLETSKTHFSYNIHELMWIQLLNEEFGVSTVINCDQGSDRTSLASALMLTISLFKQKHPQEDLFSFISQWEEDAKEVNRKVASLGYEVFMHWLRSSEESQKAILIEEFRALFLQVLEKICLPTRVRQGNLGIDSHRVKNYQAHSKWLLFLPVYGKIAHPDGSKEILKIVLLNEEGHAIDLAKSGQFLMEKFSS